ncbi:MAG: hypothetical protein ACR2HN_01100 [Tepidiformaceae bacterium]
MAGVTLDTGALIAIERGDARVRTLLDAVRRRGASIVVPAPVVAQAWRGDRNARLGAFLDLAFIEAMSLELAKLVGFLLAASRTSDVVDAAVIVGACRRRDDILTGDPGDLRRLAGAARAAGLSRPGRVISLNELPLRRAPDLRSGDE